MSPHFQTSESHSLCQLASPHMFLMNQIATRYAGSAIALWFRTTFNHRLTPSPYGETMAPGSHGRTLSCLPSVLLDSSSASVPDGGDT